MESWIQPKSNCGGNWCPQINNLHILKIDYYFAHPYSSWERGLNENTNGLVRQYIKKGIDLVDVTNSSLDIIASKLNDRPRKPLVIKRLRRFFMNDLRGKACQLLFYLCMKKIWMLLQKCIQSNFQGKRIH